MSKATQRIDSSARAVASHKEAAKRASEYLLGTRNLRLSQSEGLELVARVLGAANWQTLSAQAGRKAAPAPAGQVAKEVPDVVAAAEGVSSVKGIPLSASHLFAYGFEAKSYPDKLGLYLVKTMAAWDMPYVREHIINVGPNMQTEGVDENSEATIVVSPLWEVTLSIGPEYREEPVDANSDEGRGVLRDAGVLC